MLKEKFFFIAIYLGLILANLGQYSLNTAVFSTYPLMTRPKGHNPASDREIVQMHTVSQHYCGFCLLKFLNIQQALDVWINRYMLILRAIDKQMLVNTNFTVSTYKQKLNHQKLKNSYSSQDELLNQKVVLQIASEGMLVFRSQEVSLAS